MYHLMTSNYSMMIDINSEVAVAKPEPPSFAMLCRALLSFTELHRSPLNSTEPHRAQAGSYQLSKYQPNFVNLVYKKNIVVYCLHRGNEAVQTIFTVLVIFEDSARIQKYVEILVFSIFNLSNLLSCLAITSGVCNLFLWSEKLPY